MRIGKITLDGYQNYGNVLQSYALQQVLSQYGQVDCLWHSADNFMPRIWNKWNWKWCLKFLFNRNRFRTRLFSPYQGMEIVRQGKIKDWCDRNINIVMREGILSNVSEEYDFFVVGSDQVWNPYNPTLEDCFLFFAPKEKRIAYAASFSCTELPTDKMAVFKKGIREMAHISVREELGAEMVEEIIEQNVPVVVDPTLLLSPNDWRKTYRQPTWYCGEDYILTYFLGERPDFVSRLEEKTGMRVINCLDESIYEHYVMGPDEFLWAIDHAKLVYTDSFHGTVFSILFRTPFVVFNRAGNDIVKKMGSRIDTLLRYFGLESCRCMNKEDFDSKIVKKTPDWSKVETVLLQEKEKADNYLRQAFGLK